MGNRVIVVTMWVDGSVSAGMPQKFDDLTVQAVMQSIHRAALQV